MFIDIAISLFLAAVIVAICGTCIYVFIKHPEVLIMAIFVTIILIGLVVCPSVAEEICTEKEGVITRVAPETFNGYPILVVTVETSDGEVYTYYAEEEIDIQGTVTLMLFGEEVVDVY